MDALILAICALLLAALAVALFRRADGFTGPGYVTRAARPWAGGGLAPRLAPGHGVGPRDGLTPAALARAPAWDKALGRDAGDPRNVVTGGNAMPEIHWGALGSGSYEAYPGRDAPDAFMHPARYRDTAADDDRCRCTNGACATPVVENGGGFAYAPGGSCRAAGGLAVTGPGL